MSAFGRGHFAPFSAAPGMSFRRQASPRSAPTVQPNVNGDSPLASQSQPGGQGAPGSCSGVGCTFLTDPKLLNPPRPKPQQVWQVPTIDELKRREQIAASTPSQTAGTLRDLYRNLQGASTSYANEEAELRRRLQKESADKKRSIMNRYASMVAAAPDLNAKGKLWRQERAELDNITQNERFVFRQAQARLQADTAARSGYDLSDPGVKAVLDGHGAHTMGGPSWGKHFNDVSHFEGSRYAIGRKDVMPPAGGASPYGQTAGLASMGQAQPRQQAFGTPYGQQQFNPQSFMLPGFGGATQMRTVNFDGSVTSQPNFALRNAFVQNINNAMTPYYQNSGTYLGEGAPPPTWGQAPQFNFQQLYGQAANMVAGGYQNPFDGLIQ